MSVALGLEQPNSHLLDRLIAELKELGTDEQFVLSGEFPFRADDGKEVRRIIVLTTQSYYEWPAESREYSSLAALKRKSLLDIHSVEHDPKTLKSFYIHWFSGHTSVKSKAKVGLNLLKRALSKAAFGDFIKTKTYECSSITERWQWTFVLSRLIRDAWQQRLEERFIRSPEVFQRHSFVLKGKQPRLFVLSHSWLYNIEVTLQPTALGELKWARPVGSLKCLIFNLADSELTVTFDAQEVKLDEAHMGSKKDADSSKSQQYTFFSVDQRNEMARKLEQLFIYNARGKKLQLQVDGRFLGHTDTLRVMLAPGKKAVSTTPGPAHGRVERSSTSFGRAPLIQGKLVKLTTGWGGKHSRLVKLLPDGIIEWSEGEQATKIYSALVLGLNTDPKSLQAATKKLDPTMQQSAFFIKTTTKSLILLADNPADKQRWEAKIRQTLEALEEQRRVAEEKEQLLKAQAATAKKG